MKKKSEKIFIMLLLAIIAILCYFVSITYAKYTRKLSGNDTATIAKFSVTAKDLNKEQMLKLVCLIIYKKQIQLQKKVML